MNKIMFGAICALVSTAASATDWSQYPAGQPVSLPSGAYDVTDADFATFNALGRVELAAEDSVITFNLASGQTLTHAVYGTGKMVKSGAGELALFGVHDTGTTSDGTGKANGCWADFYAQAGLDIREGSVRCPCNDVSSYRYGHVTMASNTVFYLTPATAAASCTTLIESLNGYGMITNVTPKGAGGKCSLQIGNSPNSNTRSSYYGVIGGNMYIRTDTLVELWNENSTFSNGAQPVRNNDNAKCLYDRGILALKKFGKAGQPSSAGVGSLQSRYSATYRYLGNGEETDKGITIINANYGSEQPTIIDGGAFGGLKFTGDEIYSGWDRHGRLVFTGSNAAPCVVACGMSCRGAGGVTWYNAKEGTGTWRLANHACRTNTGPWAVREGTLQFESIAERGVTCSLGWSTALYDAPAYSKDVSDAYRVDYAVLLGGGENPVFEYVGTDFSATETRKISLKGAGATLRNSADAPAQLQLLGGIDSVDADTHELVLDGESPVVAITGNISDGTKGGRVNVTKKGSGTWRLARANDFTGALTVDAGTLEVGEARQFTWYRLTLMHVSKGHEAGAACPTADSYPYVTQLGLFDANGDSAYANGAFADYVPDGIDTTVDTSYIYPKSFWRGLQPGQVTVGDYSGSQYWTYGKDKRTLRSLFVNGQLYQTYTGSSVNIEKPGNWLPIVFRMPAGAPPVRYYDLCQCQSGPATRGHIAAFKFEGSPDGIHWTHLHTQGLNADGSCNEVTGGYWYSRTNDVKYVAGQNCRTAGQEFGYEIATGTDAPATTLGGVTGVKVAKGATLKALEAVTLPALTIDCAADAMGTIDGFAFAAKGRINLVNLDRKAGKIRIPVTFANCTGLENLAKWDVYLNGAEKPSASREVEVGPDGVTVWAKGLSVLIR